MYVVGACEDVFRVYSVASDEQILVAAVIGAHGPDRDAPSLEVCDVDVLGVAVEFEAETVADVAEFRLAQGRGHLVAFPKIHEILWHLLGVLGVRVSHKGSHVLRSIESDPWPVVLIFALMFDNGQEHVTAGF